SLSPLFSPEAALESFMSLWICSDSSFTWLAATTAEQMNLIKRIFNARCRFGVQKAEINSLVSLK
ncbi:hypothetical protein DVA76_19890, partial [Acinetobacter baumannii]